VTAPQQDAAWQFSALAGLLDALDQRQATLATLREEGDRELRLTVYRLGAVFAAARTSLTESGAPKDRQLLAVRLLGRGLDRQREDVDALAGLLVPQTDRDLQAAAVSALGRLSDPRVPELLVRGWKGYGPTLRLQVCDALIARNDRAMQFLDALERKDVLASELDPVRRQRLLDHRDVGIRERAAKILAGAVSPDRQKVVDAYQPALKLSGDRQRGVQVFTRACATCHRLGEIGHAVGPDLASVGDKSPQGLLVSILDPNRAVEARYLAYVAQMKNGQSLVGVLASETGNSVTLLEPDGKERVLLRTALEELTSTGKSLMPEGLETSVTPQEMADLIAYLRGG
jgi:putative heme-binding domain-containing protein